MIKGVHALFYSNEAVALREFMRDKLKLPFTDVGDGWLIFDLPEGDVGAHPTDHPGSPESGKHAVSFYCDDIQKTVEELKANGVEFREGISDHGYGLVTYFVMPGNVEVELYQPRYRKNPLPRPATKSVKTVAAKLKRPVKAKAGAVKKAVQARATAVKKKVAAVKTKGAAKKQKKRR